MSLFYAHYPSLENSFVNFVTLSQKKPLDKWLVVCSSSLIANRLNRVLTAQMGSISNMYFVNISSLLQQLDEQSENSLPLFPQDNIRDFLLKNIIQHPSLNRYSLSKGFIEMLKSSLRDLADSLVDIDKLEEQLSSLKSDNFSAQEIERFRWFLKVYRFYEQSESSVEGYRSYQAMYVKALERIPHSLFLKQFSKIIFYGFYDMTGRQLELLQRIKSYYDVSVFVPFSKHVAYQFARKFFETNLQGYFSTMEIKDQDTYGVLGESGKFLFSPVGSADTQGVSIIGASDPTGEIFYCAKEILRLVEEENYQFNDITIVTRNSGEYSKFIKVAFKENGIPINANFSIRITDNMLGNFCINLLSLAQTGFPREALLAIVSSPYFSKTNAKVWENNIIKSLAQRDLNQWRNLLPQVNNYDEELLEWLEYINAQYKHLETPLPWGEACSLLCQLLRDNVNENAFTEVDKKVYQKIIDKVLSIVEYSKICSCSKKGEFFKEILDVLTPLEIQEVINDKNAVTFTDAVRARGIQSKIVFVLGINDGIFPQNAIEDPIFRDKYRLQIRDVLGYWINQKLEQTDEEKLLFFTLVTSAQKKLYLLYSQFGMDGKELIPSMYLTELARATNIPWTTQTPVVVSAHIEERLLSVKTKYLTKKEISYLIALTAINAQMNYKKIGLYSPQLEKILIASNHIKHDSYFDRYDGKISFGETIFKKINDKFGYSPSALQELAGCPFRYFINKGLQLEEPEDARTRDSLPPNEKGSIYHSVLEEFYRYLYTTQSVHNLTDSGASDLVSKFLEKKINLQAYQKFGIYPLIWKIILKSMKENLQYFVQEDLHHLGNFTPSLFETEFKSLEMSSWPIKLRGIIDRVDIDNENSIFRIIDYKSSKKGKKSLIDTFCKQLIFQPFLYLLATEKMVALKNLQPTSVQLLSVTKDYQKSEWNYQEYQELQPIAQKMINLIVSLVRNGDFFINPSANCEFCKYNLWCRKDHFKSLMRAKKTRASKDLMELENGN